MDFLIIDCDEPSEPRCPENYWRIFWQNELPDVLEINEMGITLTAPNTPEMLVAVGKIRDAIYEAVALAEKPLR
jgi:hypothetical protein